MVIGFRPDYVRRHFVKTLQVWAWKTHAGAPRR